MIGRESICATVSFDGEKVGVLSQQPEAKCLLRFLSATTCMQSSLSHLTSRSPSRFITTVVASGKEAWSTERDSLHVGHG